MAQNDDKTLTSGTTNRLAIFCFYDAQGHADDYVRVFLEGLMPSIRRLIVVSNGTIDDESRAMFEEFTPFIIERENEGLDTAAYKQVLLQVGWDQLAKFDEVICCNDTCFGPIYPFQDVFDEMNTRPVDFW
ncbi:MAG: rhamnan synthesis F family protein, partial [Bifidobacteriaceae bacterium]|nr:rhamnan synthesis F family protein [Bifidobacteriaceae bacterium]